MTPRIITADEARGMSIRYAARPRSMSLVLGDRLRVVADLDSPTERTIATMTDDDVGLPVESSEHVAAADVMAHAADDVDALASTVVAQAAEIERLRAIIDGRTMPPTDAECFAHHHAGGSWLADFGGAIGVLWTASHAGARGWRDTTDPPARWWPLDADGRPCAWPVVAEASR